MTVAPASGPSERERGSRPASAPARRLGLLAAAAGVLLVGGNLLSIAAIGRFWGAAFVAGCPAVLLGLWIAVTGRHQANGAASAPRWWRAGAIVLTVAGTVAGLWAATALGR